MGSLTGAVSDSTLKMRLLPLLALLVLSFLLVNLISAGPSTSRKTSKNCKGSSSRGSTRCRPNVGTTRRTTAITTKATEKPSTKVPTIKTTSSSSRPSFRPPPKKNRPTISSVSPTDEESDSVSTSKKIKISAKKYFQKVKSRLQSAAIWYVDNKDKTIDQILVERWKEKEECSGADSKKEKRKSCVSAALAESEDDTSEEKQVKDALKSLLEEDSDGVYEFLSTSSSRTFLDIENEEEIQDKLAEMPEKYEKLWEADKSKTFSELESEFEREKTEKISELSNDMKAFFSKVGGQISTKLQSRSSSCSKKKQNKTISELPDRSREKWRKETEMLSKSGFQKKVLS